MLNKMRLKNWRSLSDVVLEDLTPITVFIGANSSGKSNLLDALYFLREITLDDLPTALRNRGGINKVRTVQPHNGVNAPIELMELEITLSRSSAALPITYRVQLKFENPTSLLPRVAERLYEGDKLYLRSDFAGETVIWKEESGELQPPPFPLNHFGQTALSAYGTLPSYPPIHAMYQYITRRWQMLNENFMPPFTLSYPTDADQWVIDECADNLPLVLDFMKRDYGTLFDSLQSDLGWLVGHVKQLELETDERETQLWVREQMGIAPTISAGTARILAMLTAYYLLEVRDDHLPGLVVIEEPDTALNPWLLSKFVEQLRNYAANDHLRQFFLTTHNPRFLDYFEPEEVRVVDRDERGFTTVDKVSADIAKIWLDEYGLGEVWTTGGIGGVPK